MTGLVEWARTGREREREREIGRCGGEKERQCEFRVKRVNSSARELNWCTSVVF